MKMMISLTGLFTVLFSLLISSYAFSDDLNIEIIKKGSLSKDIIVDSVVANDKESLSELWKQMQDKSQIPTVNFDKESVFFIISKNVKAEKIEITKVEAKPGNKVNIIYTISESNGKSINSRLSGTDYPYIIGRIENPNNPKYEISLRENYKVPPIPANQALEQDIKYTNTLSQYNLEIVNYVPLDLGNKWTYKIESDKRNAEVTQEVQSVSNGWSVLNSYFGTQNIAMKIEHSGQLIVSSDAGVRAFYTNDVQTQFVKEEIKTPAGSFKDLMIVTIPQNNNFWFRDVYAKGVGLVLHEHISPKGNGKYTLVKAKVRGKDYPG